MKTQCVQNNANQHGVVASGVPAISGQRTLQDRVLRVFLNFDVEVFSVLQGTAHRRCRPVAENIIEVECPTQANAIMENLHDAMAEWGDGVANVLTL